MKFTRVLWSVWGVFVIRNCVPVLLLLFSCFSCFLCACLSSAGERDAAIYARAVFIGDIMVHAPQLEAARYGKSWDFRPHFKRVKPLFERSLLVGNLETVFAGEAKKFAGYPAFNTPDELAPALADLGINAVMLANNHILDHGVDSALRTTKVLDDAGILWTGLTSGDAAAKPLVMEYAGLKWAFVNYSYGSNIPRQSASSEDLRLNLLSDQSIIAGLTRASEYKPDITVAFLHWGLEYHDSPSKHQRRVAALCLKNGADLVIGAHPHVLQPIEVNPPKTSKEDCSVVAYSLGNFVSFQRTSPRERSVALAIDVEKKPGGCAMISRVSVAPTWVSARKEKSRRKVEVVYAGGGGLFNYSGLSAGEVARARKAGKAALDFLGVTAQPDRDGFYMLWEASSPDVR